MANLGELLVSVGADIKGLKTGMSEVEKVTKKTGNTIQKQFGSDFTSSISNAIAGAFIVDKLLDFGAAVIDITSEFQKFEAVLTNTLGSNSAAQIALLQIQEFAAKTPFSVKELTESFVKLANQGFTPTTKQLRQLGDLASSTGKSFDQLAEAILDAQTGEFERLKEFGIRAQKAGDQVLFTFKGVETQVKFTNESIKQYVTSLGDLEGVSGSMAAISDTLGGSISNLGDSFDKLMVRLGKLGGGLLQSQVQALARTLELVESLLTSQAEKDRAAQLLAVGTAAEKVAERYQKLINIGMQYAALDETKAKIEAYDQLKENISKAYLEARKITDSIIDYVATSGKLTDAEIKEAEASGFLSDATLERIESLKILGEEHIEAYKESAKSLEIAKAELDALEKLKTAENAQAQAIKDTTKAKKEYTGILAIEIKKLEELKKEKMNASTRFELGVINQEIDAQQERVDLLENWTNRVREANLVKLEPKGLGLDTTSIMAQIETIGEFNTALKQVETTVQEMVINISGPLSDMFSNIAGAFGELAVGASSVEDFGKVILASMGDFVSQLGKMMIATGVARLALDKVFANPYAAIAAGAVLVALGAATGALMKKGPSSSPSMNTGARAGGGAASSYVGHNRQEVQVYGMIRGKDIQLSNYKTTVLDQRLGR